MNITREQSDRIYWALSAFCGPGCESNRQEMYEVLSGQLADVPDPYVLTSDLVNADRRMRELRLFLYGWLKGAKSALERRLLPPERFDELIDTLKLAPSPEGEEPVP